MEGLNEENILSNSVERSLFQQPWWQIASGGDRLEQVDVQWDGRVVGKLCFVTQHVVGLTLLKLPPYTRTQSPVLSLPFTNPTAHARNVRRVVEGLVKALPRHDRFHLFLDPSDRNVFPFWLAGCDIEEDFTFRLDAGTDLKEHWHGLAQKTRNLIRTAAKSLSVRETPDIEPLIDLSLREHEASRNQHDFAAMRRLAAASASRGQSCVLTAVDQSGSMVAASALVWDQDTLFYWQSARDPKRCPPGASNLLVWRAMEFANARRLCFDFDGCHSRDAARFGMRFGMPAVVRPSINHMNSRGRFAKTIASTFRRKPTI